MSTLNLFLSRNKKNNVYPLNQVFLLYYIKVGFKGVKIIQACFCDVVQTCRLICAATAPKLCFEQLTIIVSRHLEHF